MLTQDEAELYDRQIRLWGVNAQTRIRQSKVLMLGFNGVASEVAKILVLAGIDTLTIVDDQPYQDDDLTSNLFCRPPPTGEKPHPYRTSAVAAKLKILNPLVKVNIDNSPVQSKNIEDFKGYDLVTLHTLLSIEDICLINDACRQERVKFYFVFDYGYFGFMFNDLGEEFEFSYEEFVDNTLKVKENKESGDRKDPISLGDDDVLGSSADDEREDEEEENDRPSKKRRLHSPVREPIAKVENEKETKIGKLSYATFKDMITLKNSVYTRLTNPVLFLSIAMLKFYNEFKHLPRADEQVKEEELGKLNETISSIRNTLNLSDTIFKKLDKEWSSSIYGSLSPVCAIIGGVAGQDMIRALSNKDIPLNNTFSFDGINMNGDVQKVGIELSTNQKPQTIVRDLFEIDSD